MAGTAAAIAIWVFLFSSTVRNYRLSQAMAAGSTAKPTYT
jgi:hypothetical protein